MGVVSRLRALLGPAPQPTRAMRWVVLPLTALTVLVLLLRDLRQRKRSA